MSTANPTNWQAAHDRAVVRERTDRGLVAVSGRDRLTWLQGLLTNDVRPLEGGGACHAAWLTPQGRMIAALDAVETGDETLLDVPATLAASLAERLDQLIFAEDVRVAADSARTSLGVYGPDAARLVAEAEAAAGVLDARATGAALGALPPFGVAGISFDGTPLVVVGADHLGVPGLHLYGPRAALETLRGKLVASGVQPLDEGTAEVLRVEAGRPAFLVDMFDDTIPLEAGIEDRAISQTKGCYVGQEVIVRVLHRGQGRVAKKLVRLDVDGPDVPAAGTPLFAGDREAGRVTSAVQSIAEGRPLAFGYVSRDFLAPGTTLKVGSASGPEARVRRG